MLCHSCNQEVPGEYRFCLQCGAELREDTLVQPNDSTPTLPKTIASGRLEPTIAVRSEFNQSVYDDSGTERVWPAEKSEKRVWLVVGAIVLAIGAIALLTASNLSSGDQYANSRSQQAAVSTPSLTRQPTIEEFVPSATPTPLPSPSLFTPTPQRSPTIPPFDKWECWQAIATFKAAGLEVQIPRLINESELRGSPVPITMKEEIHFFISSICDDCGARVFSFRTQSDLNKVRDYYVGLGKPGEPFFSWVLVKDNLLVQLNGKLPEERARQYETALNNIETTETTR